MTLFRIKKNDGSLDLPILEKAIDTLLRISDQAKLQRETSNTQDSDAGKYGGLVPPQNIELTSYRESAGVTLAPNATVKASWAPVAGASYYDVELDTNESEGQGAYNKEARTNACFWQNMTLGITVKLRVRSCNSAYKSEWSEVLEKQVINGSYTSVGPLVITAKKLFRWVHASVPKINRRLYRQHRGFEWQWSTTTGFTPFEKETETGDSTIGRKITFSNHAVFRLASLTSQAYVRVRAFDSDNNKTAWSAEYSVLEEVPADIESLTVGALPLHVGFFKRVQWRLNVEWEWSVPTGGDPDMNGSFEIQYRRGTTGLWTRHFVDLDPDDKSGEHNINLAFPPKNVTPANGYVPGEYTNLYVRIRARENLIPGDWFPPIGTYPNGLQVVFVAADDIEDCPVVGPVSWDSISDSPFNNLINLQCCSSTWDAPNTFSHFSVHARIKTGNNPTWVPDTRALSKDRICGLVALEDGTEGITIRVPWYLPNDTESSTPGSGSRALLLPSAITGASNPRLSIKVVPHVWQTSANRYTPLPAIDSTSTETLSTTSDVDALATPNIVAGSYHLYLNRFAVAEANATGTTNDGHYVKKYVWRFSTTADGTGTPVLFNTIGHKLFRWTPTSEHIYLSVKVVSWNGLESEYSAVVSLADSVSHPTFSSIACGVLPLKIGWFKRTQWRLNTSWVWAASINPGALSGRFEIQYCRFATIGAQIAYNVREFEGYPSAYFLLSTSGAHGLSDGDILLTYSFDATGCEVYNGLYYVNVTNPFYFVLTHDAGLSITDSLPFVSVDAGYARKVTLPTVWNRHFVDLNSTDTTVEHAIALALPPRNAELEANGYTPSEFTNLVVRMRSWEDGQAGSWYPSAKGIQVAFVAADDADTCPTPTATFEYLPGGILARDIIVYCCEDTYDFPNSFSHFSIHARVKDNELGTWEPDTTTYRDMVCPVVHLEKGVSGVTLLVPWFLFKDSEASFAFANKAIVWPAEIESHVEIKAVPWCWEQA